MQEAEEFTWDEELKTIQPCFTRKHQLEGNSHEVRLVR